MKMWTNKQVSGAFTYIFGAIVLLLLLPFVAPLLAYTNFRGFAERIANLPGVKASGGFTSSIVTFAYSLLLVSLIGGVAIAATGSINDLETAALPTHDGNSTTTNPPTPTATPASIETPMQTPTEQQTRPPTDTESATRTSEPGPTPRSTSDSTPTPEPTPTPTPEPTPTPTPEPVNELNRSELNSTTNPTDDDIPEGAATFEGSPENWNGFQRYNYTMQTLSATTQSDVVRWSFNRNTTSATIVIEAENPQNSTRVRNQNLDAIGSYTSLIETWNRDEYIQDATWFPNNYTITTVDSSGQIWMRSNISYLEALEYNDGSTSALRLLIDYYSRASYGPADPSYCDYDPEDRINRSDIDCSS